MNLQEDIHRIKEVMGLITEEENEPVKKGINHGKVIIQPYHEGQKGKKLDSFIIGITHFDENNPVYLEKNDINPSIINKIMEVAQQCGYFYEGVGGPDLKNIERFFKEELGLNDIKDNKSYEPKISQEDKSKKDFMYTFFSNGNAVNKTTGEKLDGINQDNILLDELNKLEKNNQKPKSILELIKNGNSSKMFWDGSLSFDKMEIDWFIQQILKTPNTQVIKTLLMSEPNKENIRKFIQTGFDIMWGNFNTKKDNHGFEDGKNLLTNMANNATKLRREYIKNNLECGIYFIGEGHIGEWKNQFLDTKIV